MGITATSFICQSDGPDAEEGSHSPRGLWRGTSYSIARRAFALHTASRVCSPDPMWPLELAWSTVGCGPKDWEKKKQEKETSGCFPSLGPAEVLGRRQVRWGISSPSLQGLHHFFLRSCLCPAWRRGKAQLQAELSAWGLG